MNFEHPEGKKTMEDYARLGGKKQMPASKGHKREDPAERYERKLRELREAGGL